jgi:hypothetical protein
VGVSAIKSELSKAGLSFLSDSTINRILKCEDLVKKASYIPKGILIRFIASDQKLDIFGEKFEVPKDLVYSCVKAVISTAIHALRIYLDIELVETFDYGLTT